MSILQPVLRPVLQPLSLSLTRAGVPIWTPRRLFAAGEQGAWYDVSEQSSLAQAFYADPLSQTDLLVGVVADKKNWNGRSASDIAGSEILTNGTFDVDANWVKGTDWTISGGKAQRIASTGASSLTQSPLVIGTTYLVTVKVDAFSSTDDGYLRVLCGSSASSYIHAAGTYSFVLRCAGTTTLLLQANTPGTAVTIDSVSVKPLPGNAAQNAPASQCPALRAGGWLDFDAVDDKLTAAFPSSLGSACTVAYVNDSGVTILTGQTIGTSYDLPTADWYQCLVVNRALTATEQTRLTSYLLARRDAAINRTIAVWGDSWAGGSGATTDAARWVNAIQSMFTPRRDVYEGGVGGDSTAMELTRVQADTKFRNAGFVFVDKINVSSGETVSDWKTNVAQILQHPTSGRRLVLSTPNGTGEGTGTAFYDAMQQVNSWLSSNYAADYFDMRAYLIADGLAAAGITPAADDTADIASDTIPRSLLADGVHLNDAGNRVMAQKVHDLIVAKGWA